MVSRDDYIYRLLLGYIMIYNDIYMYISLYIPIIAYIIYISLYFPIIALSKLRELL